MEFRGNLLGAWYGVNCAGWSPSNWLPGFLLGEFKFPPRRVQNELIPVPDILLRKESLAGEINEKRRQHSVTIRVLLFACDQQPFRQPMV